MPLKVKVFERPLDTEPAEVFVFQDEDELKAWLESRVTEERTLTFDIEVV